MVIAVKLHSNGWYSDSHSKWELRGKGLIKSGFQRIWFAMCKDRSKWYSKDIRHSHWWNQLSRTTAGGPLRCKRRVWGPKDRMRGNGWVSKCCPDPLQLHIRGVVMLLAHCDCEILCPWLKPFWGPLYCRARLRANMNQHLGSALWEVQVMPVFTDNAHNFSYCFSFLPVWQKTTPWTSW